MTTTPFIPAFPMFFSTPAGGHGATRSPDFLTRFQPSGSSPSPEGSLWRPHRHHDVESTPPPEVLRDSDILHVPPASDFNFPYNVTLFNSSSNASLLNGSSSWWGEGGGEEGVEGEDVDPLVLSEGAKVGLIILYTLTTLLSISGNVLVVIVFSRGRRCRTDIRPFLINLAVADLIMAIFCMPFTFTLVMLKTWMFSKPMCPAVLFMQHLSVSASVFTNMAIGSDRFLVVMMPLRSRVMTARAKYVLVTIWTCAVGLSSVQLVVGRAVEFPDGSITCDEVWQSQSARRTFTMFVLFLTYIIPLVILALAYSVVGIVLWKRATPGNADHARDLQQLRAKRKVVKMLVLVVVMFGACWLPLHTFFLVIDFNPELLMYRSLEQERFFVALYYSVHWLAMSNSFANPVIYSFTNDSFRTDMAYIFYLVFPFCRCLENTANRKLSVSMRDRRSTLRRTISPAHGSSGGDSQDFERTRRRARREHGENRMYRSLTRDSRGSPMLVRDERSSTTQCVEYSSDKTPLKTASTYV
ncbi:QRFP-like peptide receptor isoform X2 [Babylonia areolata]